MKKRLKRFLKQGLALVCSTLLAFGPSAALAQPTSGTVVNGTASFSTNAAGDYTTITASHQAIIEYPSFNISTGETVQFVQPNTTSTVLNRVTAENPSSILGTLSANGYVYLVNPAGITFGANSIVDVGALYAAAGQMSNQDFLNQINEFSNLNGSIVLENGGELKARDQIVLMGRSLTSRGKILTTGSLVSSVGTDTIRIGEENSLIFVSSINNPDRVDPNSSPVQLGAGDLYSIVLHDTGIIESPIVVVDAGNQQGSKIEGTIDASATVGNGGTVKVLGETVLLESTAVLDASSTAGDGGTILVGGGWQGNNSDVRNADDTTVESGASLNADAGTDGDGGTIVVWADDTTNFHGSIVARGGTNSGDGGDAEVSGRLSLSTTGSSIDVSARASSGSAGTVLFDPTNITITDGGAHGITDPTPDDETSEGTIAVDDSTNDSWEVSPGDLDAVAGNVILQASKNITFSSDLTLSTDAASLTAEAGGNILVNANITTTNGDVSLTSNKKFVLPDPEDPPADFDNDIYPTNNGVITMAANTTIDAGSGNISLVAAANAVAEGSLPSTTKNITLANLTTTGDITVQTTSKGSILAGSHMLTGNNVTLQGGYTETVGTEANPILTTATTLKEGIGGVGFYVQETDDIAINSIKLRNEGPVNITAGGSILQATDSTNTIGTSDSGAVALTLTPQATNSSIGTAEAPLLTVAKSWNATSGTGGLYLKETGSVELAGLTTTGDMVLEATTNLTQGDDATKKLVGQNLTLKAASSVGTEDKPVLIGNHTTVGGGHPSSNTGASGKFYISASNTLNLNPITAQTVGITGTGLASILDVTDDAEADIISKGVVTLKTDSGDIGASTANGHLHLKSTSQLVIDTNSNFYVEMDTQPTSLTLTLNPSGGSEIYDIVEGGTSPAWNFDITDDGSNIDINEVRVDSGALAFTLTTDTGNIDLTNAATSIKAGSGAVTLTTPASLVDETTNAVTVPDIETTGKVTFTSNGDIGAVAAGDHIQLKGTTNLEVTTNNSFFIEMDTQPTTLKFNLNPSGTADSEIYDLVEGAGNTNWLWDIVHSGNDITINDIHIDSGALNLTLNTASGNVNLIKTYAGATASNLFFDLNAQAGGVTVTDVYADSGSLTFDLDATGEVVVETVKHNAQGSLTFNLDTTGGGVDLETLFTTNGSLNLTLKAANAVDIKDMYATTGNMTSKVTSTSGGINLSNQTYVGTGAGSGMNLTLTAGGDINTNDVHVKSGNLTANMTSNNGAIASIHNLYTTDGNLDLTAKANGDIEVKDLYATAGNLTSKITSTAGAIDLSNLFYAASGTQDTTLSAGNGVHINNLYNNAGQLDLTLTNGAGAVTIDSVYSDGAESPLNFTLTNNGGGTTITDVRTTGEKSPFTFTLSNGTGGTTITDVRTTAKESPFTFTLTNDAGATTITSAKTVEADSNFTFNLTNKAGATTITDVHTDASDLTFTLKSEGSSNDGVTIDNTHAKAGALTFNLESNASDVTVNDIHVDKGSLAQTIKTVSGDVLLNKVLVSQGNQNFTLTSTSGNVTVKNVEVTEADPDVENSGNLTLSFATGGNIDLANPDKSPILAPKGDSVRLEAADIINSTGNANQEVNIDAPVTLIGNNSIGVVGNSEFAKLHFDNVSNLTIDTDGSFDITNSGTLTRLHMTLNPTGERTYTLVDNDTGTTHLDLNLEDTGDDIRVNKAVIADGALDFTLITDSGDIYATDINVGVENHEIETVTNAGTPEEATVTVTNKSAVTLTAKAGAIYGDNDGDAVDIVADTISLQFRSDGTEGVGSNGTALDVTANTLSARDYNPTNGSSISGNILIDETDGLTRLTLDATAGDITFNGAGTVGAGSLTGTVATINLTTSGDNVTSGDFGTSTITTAIDTLNVTTVDGGVKISDANQLSNVSIVAGTGAVSLTAGRVNSSKNPPNAVIAQGTGSGVVADSLTLNAEGDITLNTTVNTLSASVDLIKEATHTGNINITNTGDLTVTKIEADTSYFTSNDDKRANTATATLTAGTMNGAGTAASHDITFTTNTIGKNIKTLTLNANDITFASTSGIVTAADRKDGDGNVTQDNTINLNLNHDGILTIEGPVTMYQSFQPTNASSFVLGSTIKTNNNPIAFNKAITLSGDTTLDTGGSGDADNPSSTSNITLSETVDGPFSLTLNAETTTSLNKSLGETTPLAGLTTNAKGSTTLAADIAIKTTGDISIGDSLTTSGTHAIEVGAAASGDTAAVPGNLTFGDTVGGNSTLNVNKVNNVAATVTLAQSSSFTLNLGDGDDTLKIGNDASLTGPADGGVGSDTLDYTGNDSDSKLTIDLSAGTASKISNGLSNFENFIGGNGEDTFTGTATTNVWTMTSATAGNYVTDGGTTYTFSAMEKINGGTTKNDTLQGSDTATEYTISGNDQVEFNGITFADMEGLSGGSGNDTFIMSGGNLSSGLSGGGGTDTLQGEDAASTWTLSSLTDGTLDISGRSISFTSMESLKGGTDTDTLSLSGALGTTASTYTYTGTDTGTLAASADTATTTAFSSIENITAGSEIDAVIFQEGGTLTGAFDGGTGANTLSLSGTTSGVAVTLTSIATGRGSLSIGSGTFTGFKTLTGGTGNDTLQAYDVVNTWALTNVTDGTLTNSDGTFTFSAMNILAGGTQDDSLTGPNTDTTYTFTEADGGTIAATGGSGSTTTFSSMLNVTGGTADDLVVFNQGGSNTGTIDGGTGTNTLSFGNSTDAITFNLTGTNTGTATGLTNPFVNFQNLIGGAGDDILGFTASASLSGSIAGGEGTDTLNATNTVNTWTLTSPTAGTLNAGGISLTFSAMETLNGGTADDSLTGPVTNTTYTLTGKDAGSIANADGSGSNSTFTSIKNITGLDGDDTVVYHDAGTLTGAVDVAGGSNTLSFSARTGAVTVNLTGANSGTYDGMSSFSSFQNIIGSPQDDTFNIADGSSLAGRFDGGNGTDTLNATNTVNTWTLTNPTDGTLNNSTNDFNFIAMETLTGGSSDDSLIGPNANITYTLTGADAGSIVTTGGSGGSTFTSIKDITTGTGDAVVAFQDAGSLTGNLVGGTGSNTLDYSSVTSDVPLILTTHTADTFEGTASKLTNPFSNFHVFVGGSGNDTITATDIANTWTLTDTFAGNINRTFTFSAVENFVGGTADDSLVTPDAGVKLTLSAADAGSLVTTDTTGTSTFSSIKNITGGAGNDSLIFQAGGTLSGDFSGAGGSNTLDYSNLNTAITTTLNSNNAGDAASTEHITGTFTNVQNLTGSNTNDTLNAPDTVNTWTLTSPTVGDLNSAFNFTSIETINGASTQIDSLTGPNTNTTYTLTGEDTGTITSGVFTSNFTSIQNLTAGTGNDTVVFSQDGSLTGALHGGTGANTLSYKGSDSDAQVTLTSHTAATITGTASQLTGTTAGANTGTFTDFQTLQGGNGNDTLTAANIANTWTLSNTTTGTLNSTNTFTFGAVETFNGGTADDSLTGLNSNMTYTFTGPDAGTIANSDGSGTTSNFTSIQNLTAGTGNDTVVFNQAGSLTGALIGGNGANTLSYNGTTSDTTTVVTTYSGSNINGTSSKLTGTASGAGSGTFTDFQTFIGGSGKDSLTATDVVNTWTFTSSDAGNLNTDLTFSVFDTFVGGSTTDTLIIPAAGGILTLTGSDAGTFANNDRSGITSSFRSIENITGSTGDDTIVFNEAGRLSGNLTAGAGNNTLSYNGSTSPVHFTLTSNASGNIAGNAVKTVSGTALQLNFTTFQNFVGGSGRDTLTPTNEVNTWNLTSGTSGNINGNATFAAIDNLEGGTAEDTLVAPTSGIVFGISGTDSGYLVNTAGTSFSSIENLKGNSGSDTFEFVNTGSLSGTIDGDAGSDFLTLVNASITKVSTRSGSGSVDGELGTVALSLVQGFNNIDRFDVENIAADVLVPNNPMNLSDIMIVMPKGSISGDISTIKALIGQVISGGVNPSSPISTGTTSPGASDTSSSDSEEQ